MNEDYRVASRDLALMHPKGAERWLALKIHLETKFGMPMLLVEAYRPELRQQWLWAQGRTVEQCAEKGISTAFARAGAIVTNAWSAKKSAHGWTRKNEAGIVVAAAAAVDVVPVGPDNKPYTKDDEWDEFIAVLAREGPSFGLVHFTSRGKVTDRPHLQMVEWRDGPLYRLELP